MVSGVDLSANWWNTTSLGKSKMHAFVVSREPLKCLQKEQSRL